MSKTVNKKALALRLYLCERDNNAYSYAHGGSLSRKAKFYTLQIVCVPVSFPKIENTTSDLFEVRASYLSSLASKVAAKVGRCFAWPRRTLAARTPLFAQENKNFSGLFPTAVRTQSEGAL